jgi:hypothetical protein
MSDPRAGAQPILRTGRRYLEGITEGHGWQSSRLSMKPDFCPEPIVTKRAMCTAGIRLNVAEYPELQQTTE